MIPIAQTSKYIFRRITPLMFMKLTQIAQIHTKRWGAGLIDKETVMEASKNGVVIAAINNDTGNYQSRYFCTKQKALTR